MDSPADQLEQLWASASAPPDLVSWWSSVVASATPEPRELLAALRLDQQRRWQTSQPWKVEDYVSRLNLPPGPDWPLELLVGEIEARRNSSAPLTQEELSSRFPDLSDTCQQLLERSPAGAGPGNALSERCPDELGQDPTEQLTLLNEPLDPSTVSVPWEPVDVQGRYLIQQHSDPLGEGKFAKVYRGFDKVLKRSVAIKILQKPVFRELEDAADVIREARLVAQLSHPHILPVYDVGLTAQSEQAAAGQVYVVLQLFKGGTLKDQLKGLKRQQRRMDVREAARMISCLSDALDYAWQSGDHIVHRDVKPGNVLLEEHTNRPCLADFGLSIWDQDGLGKQEVAGTPSYMSPEQLAGETHRLDGRSDVFALGVILYEILVGERPFANENQLRLEAPVEPRTKVPSIPPQLERICLKALAKQITHRYTAAELVADLQKFLENRKPARAVAALGVIKSRGLRSFGEADADFFLDLLPGQKNFDGIPESLDFWKLRIEEQTGTKTFSVGLLNGPSGCGKSSFVKAGLLPLLAEDIHRIYLEATPDTTEQDLLTGLRACRPDLAGTSGGLVELCSAIRSNPGPKVVIFLDQFEQWLHAHPVSLNELLVRALRQCDGGRLQAVLMIREEFYLSVSRLMQAIDVRILQHQNYAIVDLFDPSHAEAVLIKLGAACGKLPTNPTELSPDQQQFIHAAVQELAEGDKVIAVRLALFAQMVRNKPWTPETLTQIGGAKGVGVAFLEETFSSSRSDVRYRRHAPAVRGILKALLPGIDTEIKGSRRSSEDLRLAADYRHRRQDFNELLEILDQELRLITPTETISESAPAEPAPEPSAPEPPRSWQLTHDYLVPSIREWLTRKQKETAAGRAELKLEDRTALYTSRREPRYLPGFFDWLQILTLTRRKRWTPAESDVMRVAGRRHLLRGTAIATVLLAVGLVVQSLLVARALDGLAGQIRNANPSGLTDLLADADRQGSALDDRLRPIIQAADQPQADAATKLAAVPARLVVVIRDESQLVPLAEALLTGELTYVEPIRTRLRLYADRLRPKWLELLRNSQEPSSRRFRAALGVVGLDGEKATTDWTDEDLKFVANELSTSFAEYQPQLRELLKPIGGKLVPALDELFDAETSTPDQQNSAALALADFAGDDKELLARLLTRATARQTEILYPLVSETKTGPVRDGLLALTREQPDENLGQLDRVRLGRRRANAAITLLRQGERDAYFDALRITDDPESLSQFVHRCRSWGVTPLELLESIDRCAALRGTATGASRRLESRVMYGLLIALGSYPLEQIPAASREEVFSKLRVLYEQDPSASVHSASGWLLRTWGRGEDVAKLDELEVPYDASGERDWFRLRVKVSAKSSGLFGVLGIGGKVEQHSLTFVVFPAGEYCLGSPEYAGGEIDRQGDETPRVVRFSRAFALCDREVPWGLYDAVMGEGMHEAWRKQFGWSLANAEPVFGATWFEWVEFCRALTSEYRGDAESWQCYRDLAQLAKDGNGNPRVGRLLIERGGFRMATESEWEVSARAGQRTAYTFGSDVSLLSSYGWFVENSPDKRPQRSASKPPGVGGLHDIQGNLLEWVHDWSGEIERGSVLVDPQGPESGQYRVLRGGGWDYVAADCRVALRNGNDPANRYTGSGFRLALSPSVNPQPEAEKQPEPNVN